MFDLSGTESNINGKVTINNEGEKSIIVFSLNLDGDEIGFELSYSVKYNENIVVEDINNSVDINNISEEDYATIMTNLTSNAGIQKIVSAFDSLYSYDDYNYNYDYDSDYDYNAYEYSY